MHDLIAKTRNLPPGRWAMACSVAIHVGIGVFLLYRQFGAPVAASEDTYVSLSMISLPPAVRTITPAPIQPMRPIITATATTQSVTETAVETDIALSVPGDDAMFSDLSDLRILSMAARGLQNLERPMTVGPQIAMSADEISKLVGNAEIGYLLAGGKSRQRGGRLLMVGGGSCR